LGGVLFSSEGIIEGIVKEIIEGTTEGMKNKRNEEIFGITFDGISELIIEKYGAPLTNILINRNGDILLHDNFTFIKSGENLSGNDFIRSVLNGSDSSSKGYRIKYDFNLLDHSDNQHLVTFCYWGNEFVMFTSIDYDKSIKQKDLRAKIGSTMMFVIFLIFYIIIIIRAISSSRTISNPLKMLAVAAHNIGKGDFDIQLKAKKRNDEIGVLIKNFQKMCAALNVFGKFTNKEIAVRAMRGEIKPGGLNKYAAILFSDIRDFTATSERFTKVFGENASDHIVSWLNQYFTRMVECIEKTNGVVDKFIGDTVMAHWGTVYSDGDRELDAFNSVK
jgi:adenylate cyclase